MGKKIALSIASGFVFLLVLSFALVVVLTFQDFFGQAITWLLCICVVILMLFDLYLSISSILRAVKERDSDEDSLSEKSLERMLSGHTAELALHQTTVRKKTKKQKKTETRVRQESSREAKQRKQQQLQARKLAEAEAKAKYIADAEQAARDRAAAVADEQEKQIALAEAEALRRASMEAQKKLSVEAAAQQDVQSTVEAEHKLAEQRKAEAIEKARKQAEAMATARRRAAQSAAMSQTFTAITSDKIPEFNTRIIRKVADVTDTPIVAPAHRSSASYRAQANDRHGESIWEKMKVRQSAAPVLGSSDDFTFDFSDTLAGTQEMPDRRMTRTGSIYGSKYHTGPIPTKSAAPLPSHQTKKPVEPKPAPAVYKKAAKPAAASVEQPAVGKPQKTVAPTKPVAQPAAKITTPPKSSTAGKSVPKAQTPGWSYTPAKLPNAWKTTSNAPKIPGDMSFAGVPVPPNSIKATPVPSSTPAPKLTKQVADEALDAALAAVDVIAQKRPRGRPPKPKDENLANMPKRPRGRPPKPKTAEELDKPKRPRGRPPKPKDENLSNMPKRPRGRPPKPKTADELDKPKRPRGRPPKNPTIPPL